MADENGSGTVSWLLADDQGTIRDVVQYNSGTNTTTVVDHLKYDSFGNITAQSNSAYQPLFAYTGQMWDAAAALYYYHARWYDPHTGRFISQDPTGFSAGDANLYRYVANSPTNAVDPSGEDSEKAAMGTLSPPNQPAIAPMNQEVLAFAGPVIRILLRLIFGGLRAFWVRDDGKIPLWVEIPCQWLRRSPKKRIKKRRSQARPWESGSGVTRRARQGRQTTTPEAGRFREAFRSAGVSESADWVTRTVAILRSASILGVGLDQTARVVPEAGCRRRQSRAAVFR